ncbi:MAG: acyl-CoA dehydrogenase [Flavobacteriaceae bacterium]|jgi:acyl-CoA dehydrogenase|tara:strand:- start:5850 stop:7037 length:1188 start_codon:yes stop_codon:yes gene_type:complete
MSENNKDDFRIKTRKWLEKNCPMSMRGKTDDIKELFWGGENTSFTSEDQKKWFEAMYHKGWIAPQWEQKYGGGGLSILENKILLQEMSRLKCKQPLISFGISMLGPALLKFGNENQKDKYLNEITNGKIRWAQGYSEPNAGSDLAGLQCKAEDKGDHYLINGSKIWTSYGDMGDWIFCLVRTDFEVKKQMGISFLLIDMKSEGVMTRAIKLISGKSPFTETFFDNVKVPKENLVGELNKGWTIAKYLLTHERQMIGGMGGDDEKFNPREIALESFDLKDGILPNPILRNELSEYEMDDKIFSMTIERAIDEAKAGNESGAASSLFKYYGTELNQQRMELIMSLTGSSELIMDSEKNKNGYIAAKFLRSKGNTIEGGTSEVQLNIISKNILGLPTK